MYDGLMTLVAVIAGCVALLVGWLLTVLSDRRDRR